MGAVLGVQSLPGHELLPALAQPGVAPIPSPPALAAPPRSFELTVVLRLPGGYVPGGLSTASAATVTPSPVQQLSLETITWTVNCAALLPPGQAISSAAAHLYDTTTGGRTTVSLSPTPTVAGAVVTQEIPTGVLTAGHTYSLILLLTLSASMILAVEALYVCPF